MLTTNRGFTGLHDQPSILEGELRVIRGSFVSATIFSSFPSAIRSRSFKSTCKTPRPKFSHTQSRSSTRWFLPEKSLTNLNKPKSHSFLLGRGVLCVGSVCTEYKAKIPSQVSSTAKIGPLWSSNVTLLEILMLYMDIGDHHPAWPSGFSYYPATGMSWLIV